MARSLSRIRRLSRIAALAAVGRTGTLAREAAAARGIPRRALRETLLQVYLFAGFPRTVNALEALGDHPPDAPERLAPAAARRRGTALFRRVYGPDADRVLAAIGGRHPEFRDWIVADAYGKVLGRPGLAAAERECLAVALLATLDLPRQQVAHVRGALRCGARPAEVAAALDGVRGIAPASAVRFARARLRAESTRG